MVKRKKKLWPIKRKQGRPTVFASFQTKPAMPFDLENISIPVLPDIDLTQLKFNADANCKFYFFTVYKIKENFWKVHRND